MTNPRSSRLHAAKRILRAALATASDEKLNEIREQRIVIPIIKAQILIQNRNRSSAYFAAAEDQAWFWLSLSRRSALNAAFVAEEQAAGEYVRVRR